MIGFYATSLMVFVRLVVFVRQEVCPSRACIASNSRFPNFCPGNKPCFPFFNGDYPLFWQNEQNSQGIIGKKRDQQLLV